MDVYKHIMFTWMLTQMSTNMYSGRSNLELSEKCDKIAWLWDLILTATPQPPMWTFLKRLLQKPKPDLTGPQTDRNSSMWQCWALGIYMGNIYKVWEWWNSLVEALWHGVWRLNHHQHGPGKRRQSPTRQVAANKHGHRTTSYNNCPNKRGNTHTHTRTHPIHTTRLS